MKARAMMAFVPAACVIIAAGAAWWNLRSRGIDARKELAALNEKPKEFVKISTFSGSKPGSPEDLAELGMKLESLEEGILEKESALDETRAGLADVLEKIPVAPDEITSSFGKIDNMGRETGSFVRLMVSSMSGSASDDRKLHEMSDEEMEQVQASFFKFLAWAPLIGEMESTPSDFARFQAAAFREFYQLDDASAAGFESTISGHMKSLVANGWTVSDRPLEKEGEASDAWKAGRSAALTGLMEDLRPLLPESDPIIERSVLPSLLNAGVGLETRTYNGVDGNTNTTMGLPGWPVPPWLEK